MHVVLMYQSVGDNCLNDRMFLNLDIVVCSKVFVIIKITLVIYSINSKNQTKWLFLSGN